MDYAMKKGVSLSTLRRHIKAKRIEFRLEHGRYFLFDEVATAPGYGGESQPGSQSRSASSTGNTDSSALLVRSREAQRMAAAPVAGENSEVLRLKRDLQRAREEITELKMLIALYEDGVPGQQGIDH